MIIKPFIESSGEDCKRNKNENDEKEIRKTNLVEDPKMWGKTKLQMGNKVNEVQT